MSKIDGLNKAFESRVRLGIMSILMVNDWVDYKVIKEKLDLTDGNLASHISGLEKLEYIEVRKRFVGKKTNTSYKTTPSGRKAFQEHINALEKLLKGM
ncbi:transcriptional regulator [Paracrocinitomix mangrovi]|uniref:winged helix-turn-helix domain-containing protein n=1 Tax=Paracrocinitomix mangrovi TaxID=2862509 RepID=UPI001C8DC13D|nr:transcriptional regulator [Paracrocinitomix mangrovi]UKN01447.1 transcriptional regulator [Paracrocinitomix mangrovi]